MSHLRRLVDAIKWGALTLAVLAGPYIALAAIAPLAGMRVYRVSASAIAPLRLKDGALLLATRVDPSHLVRDDLIITDEPRSSSPAVRRVLYVLGDSPPHTIQTGTDYSDILSVWHRVPAEQVEAKVLAAIPLLPSFGVLFTRVESLEVANGSSAQFTTGSVELRVTANDDCSGPYFKEIALGATPTPSDYPVSFIVNPRDASQHGGAVADEMYRSFRSEAMVMIPIARTLVGHKQGETFRGSFCVASVGSLDSHWRILAVEDPLRAIPPMPARFWTPTDEGGRCEVTDGAADVRRLPFPDEEGNAAQQTERLPLPRGEQRKVCFAFALPELGEATGTLVARITLEGVYRP